MHIMCQYMHLMLEAHPPGFEPYDRYIESCFSYMALRKKADTES